MNALPFAGLTSLELRDLFETGPDKLKNIISDSKLPNHIKQLIPYLQQTIPRTNYYQLLLTHTQTNSIQNFQYFI